jgi:hypothetical protein
MMPLINPRRRKSRGAANTASAWKSCDTENIVPMRAVAR